MKSFCRSFRVGWFCLVQCPSGLLLFRELEFLDLTHDVDDSSVSAFNDADDPVAELHLLGLSDDGVRDVAELLGPHPSSPR